MRWINVEFRLPAKLEAFEQNNIGYLVKTDWDCDEYQIMVYDDGWYYKDGPNLALQSGILYWWPIEKVSEWSKSWNK